MNAEKGRASTLTRLSLRAVLAELVERCDGQSGVRADGSNIDTSAAHAVLAASPVEQPAAAPIDAPLRVLMGAVNAYEKETGIGGWYAERIQESCNSLLKAAGSTVRFGLGGENPVEEPAPPPADERAAFDGDSEETRAAFRAYDLQEFAARRTPWQIWRDACAWQARAASANETGADGLAHEVWAAAQLASGEGIEDGVQRIATILSRAPAQADAQDVPADDLVGFVYVLENPDRPHDPVTRFSRRPLGVRSLGAKIVSLTPVYSRPAQADGVPECNGSHDAGQIAAGEKECTACGGE